MLVDGATLWDPAIKDKRSTYHWDFEVVTENLVEIDVNLKYRMSLDTSCVLLLVLSTCHDVLCLCVCNNTWRHVYVYTFVDRRDVHTP